MSRNGNSSLPDAQALEAETLKTATRQLADDIAAEPVPQHLHDLAVELAKALERQTAAPPPLPRGARRDAP